MNANWYKYVHFSLAQFQNVLIDSDLIVLLFLHKETKQN